MGLTLRRTARRISRLNNICAVIRSAYPADGDPRLLAALLVPCRPPRPPLGKALVDEYRTRLLAADLAASTINVHLSAIRRLATEAAEAGLLAPEIATAMLRAKGVKRLGVRAGNWLTLEQARDLLSVPDRSTKKGKRHYAILALLVGCALRRSEVAELTLVHLQMRDARWVLVDLLGKGKRVRMVPVPAWVKRGIDEWLIAAAISEGKMFRAVQKGDEVWGGGLTPEAIWGVVETSARAMGIERLAPHDLRRYAECRIMPNRAI